MKIKYLFLSLFFLSSAIVVNAQNVRCVVLSIKAGTLKTQIENENKQVKKITDLVVTGYINARDFRFMRDSMPSLQNVDISNVTIKPFSGNDGTAPQYSICTVREIPAYAFCNGAGGKFIGKQSLKQITLPSGLMNIGRYAFKNCNRLKVLIVTGKMAPMVEQEALNDTVTAVYVPVGAREHYRSHKGWSGFSVLEGEPVYVTVNVENAGDLGSELLKLGHQPSEINYLTVTGKMNDDDFKLIRDYMQNLVSVDLYNTFAVSIPEYTFSQKKYLLEARLPKDLIRIGQRAFSGCTHLGNTLYLPVNMAAIEAGAFIDCDKLTHIIALGHRLNIIGKNIFRNDQQQIEFMK